VSTGAGELRIGEAAARVGVSSRTLRYYEELGLLTPSGRTPGGARRYTTRTSPGWSTSASCRS
jgi:hypothetical protein